MNLLPRTTLSARQLRINRMIWYAIGALTVIGMALVYAEGLHIRWKLDGGLEMILGIAIAAAVLWRYVWRNDSIALTGHLFAQVAVLAVAATIFSYVGARLDLPMITDKLIALDGAIGFHYRDFIIWYYGLDLHRLLTPMLNSVYFSLDWQAIVLVSLLCLTDRTAHAQRLVILVGVAAVAAVAISTALPSEMAYVYYDRSLPDFRQLHPMAAMVDDDLSGMRHHSLWAIPFPSIGLVTFPSFHAVLAVAFMYASLPLRWLRLPVVLFNVIMLVSTVICGGHYLVDVVAGIGIALGAIALAEWILPRLDQNS